MVGKKISDFVRKIFANEKVVSHYKDYEVQSVISIHNSVLKEQKDEKKILCSLCGVSLKRESWDIKAHCLGIGHRELIDGALQKKKVSKVITCIHSSESEPKLLIKSPQVRFTAAEREFIMAISEVCASTGTPPDRMSGIISHDVQRKCHKCERILSLCPSTIRRGCKKLHKTFVKTQLETMDSFSIVLDKANKKAVVFTAVVACSFGKKPLCIGMATHKEDSTTINSIDTEGGKRRVSSQNPNQVLAASIISLLEDLKIDKKRIEFIVTDGEAMMLACARELLSEGWGKESCWCLCHQINLLMDDLLKYWYSSAKSFVISVAKALKYKERNVHEKGLKMVHVCWTRWIDRLRTIKMLVDERNSYRELLEDIGTLEADQALQFFQNPGFINNPMIDFVRDYFLYFERAILAAEGNCIVSMERSVVALISHVRDLEVEDEPTPNVKERLERIENSLGKYKQAMIIHPLGKIEEEEKYMKLLEQHGCPEAKEFIQFDVCALITKKKTLAIMVDKYERMIKAAELTDKGEEKKRQKEIKLIHSKIETIAATFFDEKKFDIIRGVCLKVLSVPCSGADVERFFSRFSFIYSPGDCAAECST
ncbi:hypothetical protein ADUPG1_013236 [Aduncisulcus paluster]|uniref:Transposase n=1 Tax=Aduncisulcus paluster TaxID=2918883 RepID=A0ABQ5K282_9EUKA|nr:hypothetical protein ADUPG1_013236 [Aduncisulcus paluster]